MASTRDINSQANYCLEQRMQNTIRSNKQFYNNPNGHAFTPAYAGLTRQGYMPPDNFSFNSTDIESALFGIGSTNLVEAKPITFPQFKELPTVNFFEKPELVKTKQFNPLFGQRPFICQ
jgi:hypothetical protein